MRFTSSTLLTILFYVISGGLAFYLYSSIKFEVEEEKRIERSENKVIERLKVLREAQIAYREVYGQYASNMDTLMEFIDNGTFYITTRNEEIITLDYGRDSVVVSIDTLGTLPASDRIYKEFVYANATDEGVFVEYFVTEGQEVTKGDNLYTIRVNDRRESKIRAKESGTITLMKEISEGEEVSLGEPLVTIEKDKFNRKFSTDILPYLPENPEKKFDIFADKIDRNGVMIDVFEIKDTDPVNPKRRINNNAGALRVGSRTNVSTAGNWE